MSLNSGTVVEWVRALSHSEWMVTCSNPGNGRNYFYSLVGDGGISITCIDGYIVAINNYVLERVTHFIGLGLRTMTTWDQDRRNSQLILLTERKWE